MRSLLALLREHKFGTAAFLAPLPAALYFMSNREAAGAFVSHWTFWCMLALTLAWAGRLVPWLRALAPELRANLGGLLFCLAAAAAVFAAVKPEFRVLADETNLLGVSRTMVFERRAENVTMAKNYYFNQWSLARENEKRPYMYPFLTAAVHAVSGYRPANAFAVNFLLLAALLSAVFLFFRQLYGPAAAGCAVLLTASQPLLALTASSGGMDFMAAALLFFAFLALLKFLREPGRDSFALLWATLLVLANTRYEGASVTAAVFAGLLLARRLKWDYLATPAFLLTPFVMLPTFCQRLCLSTNYENPPGMAPFMLANLPQSVLAFIRGNFDFTFFYPYAAPVAVAGTAAAFYFTRALAAGTWPAAPERRAAVAVSAGAVALYALVVFSYSFVPWGPTQQASARVFAPFTLALTLLAGAGLGEFLARRPGAAPAALLCSAALFAVYLPNAGENRFMNQLILTREHKLETGFLERLGGENVLVVSGRPGMFVSLGYGAVTFDYARANSAALLTELDRKLYTRLLAMQEVLYATGLPTPETDLSPEYAVKPVFEAQNTENSFVRIVEATRPPEKKR